MLDRVSACILTEKPDCMRLRRYATAATAATNPTTPTETTPTFEAKLAEDGAFRRAFNSV